MLGFLSSVLFGFLLAKNTMAVMPTLGLITMFDSVSGKSSGAHGLTKEFIFEQAEAMGMPIRFGCAAREDYERVFTDLLAEFRAQGAQTLVTGDMDLPDQDCWHERVSAQAGLRLSAPLWRMDHTAEAREFVDAGFSSVLVCVDTDMGMREEDVGRMFDHGLIDELLARGIDPAGEAGEFHTAVIDGPLFRAPLRYRTGDVRIQEHYRLLDLYI